MKYQNNFEDKSKMQTMLKFDLNIKKIKYKKYFRLFSKDCRSILQNYNYYIVM